MLWVWLVSAAISLPFRLLLPAARSATALFTAKGVGLKCNFPLTGFKGGMPLITPHSAGKDCTDVEGERVDSVCPRFC